MSMRDRRGSGRGSCRWVAGLAAAFVLAGTGAGPLAGPVAGQEAPDPNVEPVRATIAPELRDVPASSAELDRAERVLDTAQDDMVRAITDLGRLGRELVDLADLRVRTRQELVAAGEAITAAEADLVEARRLEAVARDAEAAASDRLRAARDEVRTLAVDGYVRSFDSPPLAITSSRDDIVEQAKVRILSANARSDKLRVVAQRKRQLDDAADRRLAATAGVGRAAVALRDARQYREDVAADLAETEARIVSTEAAQDRQTGVVLDATAARDRAEGGVQDARVLATVDGGDFPVVALDAYFKAAAAAPCPAEWWGLAGIGRTESFHGTFGGASLGVDGRVTEPIIGIPLNGANNTAVVSDSDGGRLDGDTTYDRAVGPMQFIPSTWARWGADGNDDGQADPQNLYDAAAAAARYLCASGRDLTTDAGLRSGYFSYNQSSAYVEIVLRRARAYQVAVPILPTEG